MATTGLFSCKQNSKLARETVGINTLDPIKNVQSPKPHEKYIDTKYKYTDSASIRLIIENSLPKSGITYTDPNGQKYVYAVFWTRIINETVTPIELILDFPLDSFELTSSSGNYFKLFIPSDTMTLDKEPLFDYGLAVKSFLDNGIYKSSSLKRMINPKESSAFYVVTLSNHGINGTLRAGLSLKEPNIFYRINDREIYCGQIILKK